MILEIVDKDSGAILFKKDQESKNLDYALKKIEDLEKTVKKLTKQIKSLEENMKK